MCVCTNPSPPRTLWKSGQSAGSTSKSRSPRPLRASSSAALLFQWQKRTPRRSSSSISARVTSSIGCHSRVRRTALKQCEQVGERGIEARPARTGVPDQRGRRVGGCLPGYLAEDVLSVSDETLCQNIARPRQSRVPSLERPSDNRRGRSIHQDEQVRQGNLGQKPRELGGSGAVRGGGEQAVGLGGQPPVHDDDL